MEISQPNNATGSVGQETKFGIRISAPPGDPFRRLVGDEWHGERWFATREERDRTLQEMVARHRYSRIGDLPSIVVEPVERA
jgi:hypothetical protein